MRAEIDKKTGWAVIVPESYEDLWYIYKIIDNNTIAKSITTRKYKPPGSNKEERVVVNMEIKVEKRELHKHSKKLRLTGKITFVKPESIASLGSYHTIDVEIGKEIKLHKEWKKHEIDMIEEAIKNSRKTLVNIIVIDNEQTTIAKMKPYGVEIEYEISNSASKSRDKNIDMNKFFKEVGEILNNLKGLIILGGPGFTKDNLLEYLKKEFPQVAKRIRVVSASNAERSGIYEILRDETLYNILENERIYSVMADFEKFLKCIAKNGSLCTYGIKEIKKAAEYGSIEKLLILDEIAREHEDIINLVEASGGKVIFVPSESEIGNQIKALGGLIGLLRFAV